MPSIRILESFDPQPKSRELNAAAKLRSQGTGFEGTPPVPVSKAILHLKRPNTHRELLPRGASSAAPVALACSNKSVYSCPGIHWRRRGATAILSGLLSPLLFRSKHYQEPESLLGFCFF